jgi:ubiquitin-like protein Pup
MMADQERKQVHSEDAEVDEIVEAKTDQSEEITDRIDDLLDEIDSVLEENAEEFVKNYVQKGGE